MPLARFRELMADAARGGYAVGYFECWDLDSLFAAADAAEKMRSPVLLGFSGIYLPHPERLTSERLSPYAALGLETCRGLSVPAGLVFNESPHRDWVAEAIRLHFELVMYTDEQLECAELARRVCEIVESAHPAGVAVEAELMTLPGVGGELTALPPDLRMTDPRTAAEFVERTGVDALAVNIGQAHLHGRVRVRLDLERLTELERALSIPLVLHGASSVAREDLAAAISLGVRKVNVGSALKRTYFESLRRACSKVQADYNPYDVVGSGLSQDVLTAARLDLQSTIQDLMVLFGSAGKAATMESSPRDL